MQLNILSESDPKKVWVKMHNQTLSRRALGYFPICQLVPEDKHQLSLNETEVLKGS